MHIYDTLIIGCSYTSVGYAVARKNCIICEKTELCDTHFGASLCSFAKAEYEPKTDEGKKLIGVFENMKLFKDGMQNANGFECALCKYIVEKDVNVLLKCRAIDVAKENGVYAVTVITNSGLEKMYANYVKDFSCSGADFITVQFVSHDIDNDILALKKEFGEVEFEKAFYENRYALFLPTNGMDINLLKLDIYDKWKKCGTKAKILHIPSAMFSKSIERACDEMFDSFAEAFEFGMKEAEK